MVKKQKNLGIVKKKTTESQNAERTVELKLNSLCLHVKESDYEKVRNLNMLSYSLLAIVVFSLIFVFYYSGDKLLFTYAWFAICLLFVCVFIYSLWVKKNIFKKYI